MKSINLFFSLILISVNFHIFAQKSNEVDLYYGISKTDFIRRAVDGGSNYNMESYKEYGFKYLYRLSENTRIETGFNYAQGKIKITPEYMGVPVQSRFEKLKLYSIPIYINYTFWKYLYLNGGAIIDIQSSSNDIDSQSGIGLSAGFGIKYKLKNFIVFVNPNIKIHSFQSILQGDNKYRLIESGVQIGLGYQFNSKK